MQSFNWYLRRLRSMSPQEIAWRCSGKLADATDRVFWRRTTRMPSLAKILIGDAQSAITSVPVLGSHLRNAALAFQEDLSEPSSQELLRQADQVLAHRLNLFDQSAVFLGEEIDWNREFKAGKAAPMRPSPTVDYRDYAEVGDCKFVWEPSRHYQLVVLGRAYRLAGDERYAEELLAQIESWIRGCPCGLGMNWRSPLELGIRIINWVWALELIRDSAALTGERLERIVPVAWQHLADITRHYSKFSSANNHAIGEAAGVFIGSSYFSGLKDAARWRGESRAILERELLRQTYDDGGTREQATGYHLFVLQFLVLADVVAGCSGEPFSDAFHDRLLSMFDFAHAMADGSATMPMIGDADDGYVIDLGGRGDELRSWMAVGAVLFERPDWKRSAGKFGEPACWLLGPEARERFERLGAPLTAALKGRALRDSGYYLLQRGNCDETDRVSVVFDAGELGFLSIAAHGHADALSLVLRVGGVDVLVDPGTYDYFTYPAWREYFRSTRAHNTIVIDGADQSEPLGPFLWGRRAASRLIEWSPNEQGGTVSAEHDGYTRLADPVTHRRSVTLDDALIVIRDDIDARARHEVTQYWHFSEHCQVRGTGRGRFRADFGIGTVTLNLDERLTSSSCSGSTDPIAGWVSRGYHRKTPGTTIIARGSIDGCTTLRTTFDLATASAPL